MPEKGQWWTCPTEADNGNTIIVTGRADIEKFRKNPKFNIRIEVSWKYLPEANGMPDLKTSEMMETVTNLFCAEFDKDPVAVLTGIYTGDGCRDWIFYSLSTNIFGNKINRLLADLPVLPITIYCENDPEWNEYDEMREASEIKFDD